MPVSDETQTCRECGKEKPLTAFRKTGSGRHQTCAECVLFKVKSTREAGTGPVQRPSRAGQPRPPKRVRSREELAAMAEAAELRREHVAVVPGIHDEPATGLDRKDAFAHALAALRAIGLGQVVRDGRVVTVPIGPDGMREIAKKALAECEAARALEVVAKVDDRALLAERNQHQLRLGEMTVKLGEAIQERDKLRMLVESVDVPKLRGRIVSLEEQYARLRDENEALEEVVERLSVGRLSSERRERFKTAIREALAARRKRAA